MRIFSEWTKESLLEELVNLVGVDGPKLTPVKVDDDEFRNSGCIRNDQKEPVH